MQNADNLTQQLLSLPQEERAALAAALIRSLDDPKGAVSEEESRRAWMEEARHRAEAYDRGDIGARDWEAFRDEIRTKLQ